MPSITPLTSLPKFTSKEEHAQIVASTPASFSDIPPVLQYKEDNVRVVVEPRSRLPWTSSGEEGERGTLYILTSALVFFSSTSSQGFQISYPSITLHAISKSNTSGPSIYCQLDESLDSDLHAMDQDQNEEEGEEERDTEMSELWIIPQSVDALEPIFDSLSHCASLHPDPQSPSDSTENLLSGGDADEAFIDPSIGAFEPFTGQNGEELDEAGKAALEYLESVICDPFRLLQDSDEEGYGEVYGDEGYGDEEEEEGEEEYEDCEEYEADKDKEPSVEPPIRVEP